ncbi:MAG TPA: hypothetical protein ENN80_14050, partial [Candidatus Hydrogenedentes bacterium]|nr:hypothetical protein [Candidatus Hydrogenedentota bacterium]
MVGATPLGVFLSCIAILGAASVQPVDLQDGWQEQTKGPWRTRYDHRDLRAMRHPWVPSEKGAFASLSRPVTVPVSWKGPVYLSFYCSDDYHTDTWRPDGSWLTAEGFVGHRFKQVLVDDDAVWSEDVNDPVKKGVSPRYRVKLPVEAGRPFLITLLAYDAEPSTHVLEGDFYQSANDEIERDEDPNAANFQTLIYWGDLYLLDGDAEPPAGRRPTELKVRAVHTERWPLPPFGDAWESDTARLDVSAPAGLPKRGFPLCFGVPLHVGKANTPADVAFTTSANKPTHMQKRVLGRWPDDSLQWLLVDFPVNKDIEALYLDFTHDKTSPRTNTVAGITEDGATLEAGALSLMTRRGDPIADIKLDGKTLIDSITLGITVDGETVAGTTASTRLVDEGAFRSTVLLEGRFDAIDRSLGSFHLYCSVYDGMPYIRLWFRWFSDTGRDIPVSSLRINLNLPEPPDALRVPDWPLSDGARVMQTSETERFLGDTPIDPKAPLFLAWNRAAVAVHRFAELFPKAVSADGRALAIDLVAAGDEPVVFTPGEAKTHELWLSFDEDDPAQFAATVEHPPILQNAAYYCATGVLGRARAHNGVPVLHEHMTKDFAAKTWQDFGLRAGVRHFPDSPHYGGLPNWANNYYERMLNLFSEWFMSGDRAWYDLGDDLCRHLMDVAIVHSEIPGKDWLGAIHGPGENHVAGPWNPNLRIAGLDLYHKLTGDPEAHDAVMGVVDFCACTHAGIDGGSVRQQAGSFDAVCTGYAESGEVRLLDEGAGRVASALRAMDMRRGVWPDEHGSKVYRGNIPWMDAQI